MRVQNDFVPFAIQQWRRERNGGGKLILDNRNGAYQDTISRHMFKTQNQDTYSRHIFTTHVQDTYIGLQVCLLHHASSWLHPLHNKATTHHDVFSRQHVVSPRHTFKTHVQDTLSRHMFKTRLQDTCPRHMFKTCFQDTLSRHTFKKHVQDTLPLSI